MPAGQTLLEPCAQLIVLQVMSYVYVWHCHTVNLLCSAGMCEQSLSGMRPPFHHHLT